jgi:geranylgeranyl diphosphate synthase type II
MIDPEAYLRAKRYEVDAYLDRTVPPEDRDPQTLHRAMRYTLFAGGKRLRPVLAMAAAEAAGSYGHAPEGILPLAGALELIHTYSLIHDDLPAMDNDDLRRGAPTCHRVFGEAMAILAGDGLLTLAFELLSREEFRRAATAERACRIVEEMSRSCGSLGLVGGQAVDIESQGKPLDLPTLQSLHARKTGALIRAAVRTGGIFAGAEGERLEALTRYGEEVGLAFQVVDDLLDLAGDERASGKGGEGDRRKAKPTYPALLGVQAAKEQTHEMLNRALKAVEGFGERADPLRAIARFMVERTY